ncbi:MAG: hypothetical protein II897_04120 [Clostridia bacterium]|nr:hypothetical protein [Clostridia bacterium]
MNTKNLEKWKQLGDKAALLPCPRCGRNNMKPELHTNALSRRYDVYICESCGTEEALEDYTGKKKPLEEWFVNTTIFGTEPVVKQLDSNTFSVMAEMEVTLTVEDIDDIVCTALEGGITYWADKCTVVGDYLGEWAHEQIARGGVLKIHDSEEFIDYHLDLTMLLNGIRLALRNGWGDELLDSNGKIDLTNLDGRLADDIIQFALFGDVIYG